jgi:hypothetical protein
MQGSAITYAISSISPMIAGRGSKAIERRENICAAKLYILATEEAGKAALPSNCHISTVKG